MSTKIIGNSLPNIPWFEKAEQTDFPIWRYQNNPIIGWNTTKSTARIFNSAVVPFKNGFAGVFRADHRNCVPLLHVGFSDNGLNWNIDDETIKWKDENGNYWNPTYAYDPRVTQIGNRFYIVWCTDFDSSPTLGMGYTDDFKTFTRINNPFFPFNRNGVLFPRQIDGKYILLSRPSDGGHTAFGDIFLSESPDLKYWGNHRKVMSTIKTSWWQGLKIGAGPVPIETDSGWLLFYHGVVNNCNGYVYSIGVALLDINDPSIVLKRSSTYILTPEKSYETAGFVPNVCFPCATLCDGDSGKITLFYGAADSYTAIACTTIDEIMSFLDENSELGPIDALPVK